MRFLVVVHEVEGVIKEDAFLGPFRSEQRAKAKAAAIERGSRGLLQARVEYVDPGSISVRAVIALWGARMVEKVLEFAAAGETVRPDGSVSDASPSFDARKDQA